VICPDLFNHFRGGNGFQPKLDPQPIDRVREIVDEFEPRSTSGKPAGESELAAELAFALDERNAMPRCAARSAAFRPRAPPRSPARDLAAQLAAGRRCPISALARPPGLPWQLIEPC